MKKLKIIILTILITLSSNHIKGKVTKTIYNTTGQTIIVTLHSSKGDGSTTLENNEKKSVYANGKYANINGLTIITDDGTTEVIDAMTTKTKTFFQFKPIKRSIQYSSWPGGKKKHWPEWAK